MKDIYIIKANGEKEAFSVEKAYRSARRAGASDGLAKEIAENVLKQIYPDIKTSEIFRMISAGLKKESSTAFLKFNLKEGIKKLGPTGFLFEKFVGEILSNRGFKVEINQHIPGHCVDDYEIDFTAEKDNVIYVGECKYRNFPGEIIHLPVALANYARFLDIKNGPYFAKQQKMGKQLKSILVANTKFTHTAKKYSACVGVNLLGWRHPKNEGLEHLIEQHQLYPITVLPLKSSLKDIFVDQQIMLVKDLLKIDAEKFSRKFKVPISQINSLISLAKSIL